MLTDKMTHATVTSPHAPLNSQTGALILHPTHAYTEDPDVFSHIDRFTTIYLHEMERVATDQVTKNFNDTAEQTMGRAIATFAVLMISTYGTSMLLAPYISVIARAAYPMIHRIIFGVVPHPLQPAYWITYIVFKERFCSLASKHSGTIATGAVTGIHLIFGGISSLFYTIGDKIVNRHEQRSQTSEHSSEIADLPQLVPKQPSPILSDQRGWSTRFLNLFQDTKKTVIDSDEFVMLDMDGTATMAMASARKEL